MARTKIHEQVEPEADDEVDPDFDVGDVMATLKPTHDQDRWDAIEQVASEFSLWRPAPEVLVPVRSIPTVFPMFDRATRVFGYPIDRVNTVHGPSNHGKTAFTLGLGLSFLRQYHIYAHMDAERTTPASWISKLYAEQVHNPGFVAMRPRSFEEAVDGTKQLVESVAEARLKGRLPPETSALVVVDSIRKLAPKALLAKLAREGADGLGGRAAQLKAAMNQAWLDELSGLLDDTGTSVCLIARESERPNATDDDRKYDKAWQVQGGKGIIYDASLVIRVTRASYVYGPGPKGKSKPVYGEKIKLAIWKTKVESKEDKHAIGYFHMSNGELTPEGFDHARDVLELAKHYGIVEVNGSWFSYNGERLGQGENNAVIRLNDDPDLATHIEDACRQEFKPDEVVEVDMLGEED